MIPRKRPPSPFGQQFVRKLEARGALSGPALVNEVRISTRDLFALAQLYRHEPRLRAALKRAVFLRRAHQPQKPAAVAGRAAVRARSAPELTISRSSAPSAHHSGRLSGAGALVTWLGPDHLLVRGNLDLALSYGRPVYDLPPGLAAQYGAVLGSVGLQLAALGQSAAQSGTVLRVTDASRVLLERLGPALSDGQMLGVLRGPGGRMEHVLRLEQAGSGLRGLASLGTLTLTLAHLAGQMQMMRTLRATLGVCGDIKSTLSEERVAQALVDFGLVLKVRDILGQVGELSPGLLAQLPDAWRLRTAQQHGQLEQARLVRQLRALPDSARERGRQLETLAPDLLLALGLTHSATWSLQFVEDVNYLKLEAVGDAAARAMAVYEQAHRRAQAAESAALLLELASALEQLRTDPGGGWFAGSAKDRVRQQVADLANALTQGSTLPQRALE